MWTQQTPPPLIDKTNTGVCFFYFGLLLLVGVTQQHPLSVLESELECMHVLCNTDSQVNFTQQSRRKNPVFQGHSEKCEVFMGFFHFQCECMVTWPLNSWVALITHEGSPVLSVSESVSFHVNLAVLLRLDLERWLIKW